MSITLQQYLAAPEDERYVCCGEADGPPGARGLFFMDDDAQSDFDYHLELVIGEESHYGAQEPCEQSRDSESTAEVLIEGARRGESGRWLSRWMRREGPVTGR
ncbi:MAG: hypothetical protein ACYCST_10085 [Acidimicrobiales bacterium]